MGPTGTVVALEKKTFGVFSSHPFLQVVIDRHMLCKPRLVGGELHLEEFYFSEFAGVRGV
jgi:hypothetical protein